MTLSIITKVLTVWFAILVIAIANGTLREALLVPFFGKVPGYILSGVILSILIIVVSYLTLPWFGISSLSFYVTIGCCWLLLTLIFEFSFGHLIQGKPWSELLEAYLFKDGNIWPVVLLVTAMAPYLCAKLRGFL